MLTNLYKQDKYSYRRKYESFLFKEGMDQYTKGAIDENRSDKYSFLMSFKIGVFPTAISRESI